ncbi:IS3 family transposase, partial [Gemella sp. zg-1178]|uniref:IS3 family transposase n=1 Tax=Gemella sp. zg-1178 TaxID=2840372 RepID=UPI001C042817
CHIHSTLKQRLEAINPLKNQHNIKLLCKVLNVNRSTYYKYISSKISKITEENQYIFRLILEIHGKYKKRLGIYKITHILNRDYGIKISVGRVYRLNKKLNLPTMPTVKPFIKRNSVDTEDSYFQNHLNKEFNPTEPNLVWVSDFTYIKVNNSWVYLCVIMDLFSRKIVSWNISKNQDSNLIISIFNEAYEKRNRPKSLMFHSNRGTQFTSFAFRSLLDNNSIVQSFSDKGHPYNNACCESFFKYLKKEEGNRKSYFSSKNLYLSLFEYIESYYNDNIPHSSLDYMTPNDKELEFLFYTAPPEQWF